jgi:hypothetical protein
VHDEIERRAVIEVRVAQHDMIEPHALRGCGLAFLDARLVARRTERAREVRDDAQWLLARIVRARVVEHVEVVTLQQDRETGADIDHVHAVRADGGLLARNVVGARDLLPRDPRPGARR